jgi:hypothetical protein
MAGKTSRKLQLGRETTAGTRVNCTAVWRGVGTIDDQTEVVYSTEDVGYLSGTDRSYIPRVDAALTMDDTEATFEQLPYLLEAGIQYVQTGVTDTDGSGKIYVYSLPTTQGNTIKTYTIEGGDSEQTEYFTYGFVERLRLSGQEGEAVKMSADWRGREDLTTAGYTAGLSLPTVEEVLFGKGNLYIDDVTSMGETTAAETLLAFDLDIDTGWRARRTADGGLHFGTISAGPVAGTLNITFLHNSVSIAEKAAWKQNTPRNVRLEFSGSDLTSAGDSYRAKTLRIDLTGKWSKFDKLGEQDGNDILTASLRIGYNESADHVGTITVVNQLTSLP